MTVSPTPHDQAREELTKISSLVLTARRLVAGGTLVDLSAIEERVKALCDMIQAMERDEARPLSDEMKALMAKLDHLASELRERLSRVADSSATDGEG